MKLTISTNFSDIEKQIASIGRQAEFAAAKALTQTAKDMQLSIYKEMGRVFDRPAPFTLNSIFIKPATIKKLEAVVWLKDDVSKGTPADRYLSPQIKGGGRHIKRFESALVSKGIMQAGWRVVPGNACELDAFGNISKGQIVKILSYLQAFGEQGYRANITNKKKDKMRIGTKRQMGIEYIVSKGRGVVSSNGRMQHLAAGVWIKTHTAFGTSVKPLLIFVSGAQYKKRLDFFGIGNKEFEKFKESFDRELQAAIDSAFYRNQTGLF